MRMIGKSLVLQAALLQYVAAHEPVQPATVKPSIYYEADDGHQTFYLDFRTATAKTRRKGENRAQHRARIFGAPTNV